MRRASCDLWTHFAPRLPRARLIGPGKQTRRQAQGARKAWVCEAVNHFAASVGLTGFHVSKMQIATSHFLISPS